MENMWLVWLVLAILFLIIELTTVALVSIWFAAGCLVAFIASLAGAELWLQILLMVVVSVILLMVFLLLRKKLGIFPGQKARTNADRLIGEIGEVIQDIDTLEAVGQVRVSGQIWSARTEEDRIIPIGEKVRILDLQGVKLVVETYQG